MKADAAMDVKSPQSDDMKRSYDNDEDGTCKRSRTAEATTNDDDDRAVVTPTNSGFPLDLRKWMNEHKGDQEQMLADLCKFKHDPAWWKDAWSAAVNDTVAQCVGR